MSARSQKQRVLIKGAMIASKDFEQWAISTADILIEDGLISAIGSPPNEKYEGLDKIIEGKDRLVMPGLVNAHTHSPLSVVHGAYDLLNHRACMWLFQAYTANRTPREVYISTMLNSIELLLSGTTAALDHFPEQAFTEEDVEAAVLAYRDAGIRAHLALRVFDGEYTDILPENGELPLSLQAEVQRLNPYAPDTLGRIKELCVSSIELWHGDSGRISIGPAPSNPMRCSDDLLEMCVELGETHNVGTHCHLLETEVQSQIAFERYKTTTVRHLDAIGLLSPKLSCAHTIWINEADIQLMADKGASVVHNPESNFLTGSGRAPIPEMIARGVNVGLGSDGSCSSGDQSIHRAMKLATAVHRNAEKDRAKWIGAETALEMGTVGGATAMFSSGDFGSLTVGKKADLVLYDLTQPCWAPLNDPIYQFVQSETGAGVDTVIVGGSVLVEGGKISAFDADAVLEEARSLVPAMKDRNKELFEVVEKVGAVVI